MTKPRESRGKKKKAVAPTKRRTASRKQQVNYKAIRSRSTSTLSQRKRALALLKASPQTTYSLRKKGISHPAQRLKELIRDGYLIISTRVNAVDSDGYTHINVALYQLVMEPQHQLDLPGVSHDD